MRKSVRQRAATGAKNIKNEKKHKKMKKSVRQRAATIHTMARSDTKKPFFFSKSIVGGVPKKISGTSSRACRTGLSAQQVEVVISVFGLA